MACGRFFEGNQLRNPEFADTRVQDEISCNECPLLLNVLLRPPYISLEENTPL